MGYAQDETGDNSCEILVQCCPWKVLKKGQVKSLYSFPQGCLTNYHKLLSLKQQKWIISQFWRLEVQNQGVIMAMLPSKALGENSSLFVPSFKWSPAMFGVLWFIDASLQSLPLSSYDVLPLCFYLHVAFFSLCMCPNFRLLIRVPGIGFWLTVILCDLILTSLHLERPISK